MTAITARWGEEALEGWMRAYQGELRAYLRRFVGPDDAEDLLQEVWIRAHGRPPEDGPEANVRAWLYRVSTRTALDLLSRRRRRTRLLDEEGHRLEPEAPSPPDPAVVAERRRQVREGIARLPRRQREAVWLRWVDGLSYEAVSERLACSPESARANVYQGLKRLRRDLEKLLTEDDR